MIDDKFEQILYLTCKSLITSESPMLYLELYREVRNSMIKIFGEEDNFYKVTIIGQIEEFKDVLNFCLTILCELGMIQQKDESNPASFRFKWIGIKGFTGKYLSQSGVFYSITPEYSINLGCYEGKIQTFTRRFMAFLILNRNFAIDLDITKTLTDNCELNGYENQIDKIIALLLFLEFIMNQQSTIILNINLFNHSSQNLQDPYNIMGEVNNRPLFTEPDQFTDFHNKVLIDKIQQWNDLIEQVSKQSLDKNSKKNKKEKLNGHLGVKYENGKKLNGVCNNNGHHEPHEEDINDKIKENKADKEQIVESLNCNLEKLKEGISQSGFAMLKGSNWIYYLKDIMCIIGRSAEKHSCRGFIPEKQDKTPWELDVNLGQHKGISRQHALIAYNFEDGCFEIKNLSKRFSLKVNGEIVKPNEDLPLSSKSSITIGNQEFYFLLPVDS